MTAHLYVAGKATGESEIIRHGDSTLLVRIPGGFDATTGAKLPPVESGLQRSDIQAARDRVAAEVAQIEAHLASAKEALAAHDVMLADADAALRPPAPSTRSKAKKKAKKR